MEESNLNRIFIWSPVETIDKLHKQPNGNSLRRNGVVVFAPSMVWHYVKNYSLKGKKPFSLVLCTLTDDDIAINKYLDKVAKRMDSSTINRIYEVELSPMFLATDEIYTEGK